MRDTLPKNTTLVTIARVRLNDQERFCTWQGKFHALMSTYKGFVSLEILSPEKKDIPEWMIFQRFFDRESLEVWQQSDDRKQLLQELQEFAKVSDVQPEQTKEPRGVTEVFVTKISPNTEAEYRKWMAKIHQAEAKFVGFRGVYVQSPFEGQGEHWITLLHFDTPEHLDLWLHSEERKEILQEGKLLISFLESHRVMSSFAGWFQSLEKEDRIPPVWKQTLLVLLVLYPIVMLQMKFLTPVLSSMDRAYSTFIANAISVCLISWPFLPISIYFLHWWLNPKTKNTIRTTVLGTVVVLFLYALEIILLQKL